MASSFVMLALVLLPLLAVPTFRIVLKEFGGPLPSITAYVLSDWVTPSLALVPAAFLAVGLWSRWSFRVRQTLLVASLVVGFAAFALCWKALHLPLEQMTAALEPPL